MQPAALKMPRKTLPDMAWPGGQKFSGYRTENFKTIAEKFYPRIKIFGGTVFFLTVPVLVHHWIYLQFV